MFLDSREKINIFSIHLLDYVKSINVKKLFGTRAHEIYLTDE
jgi:hypothetical protein